MRVKQKDRNCDPCRLSTTNVGPHSRSTRPLETRGRCRLRTPPRPAGEKMGRAQVAIGGKKSPLLNASLVDSFFYGSYGASGHIWERRRSRMGQGICYMMSRMPKQGKRPTLLKPWPRIAKCEAFKPTQLSHITPTVVTALH